MAVFKCCTKLGLLTVVLVLGCADKNEHFCAKYSYFYNELTQPGILPLPEIRNQLEAEVRDPKKDNDRSRMALLVLDDLQGGFIHSFDDPREFCFEWRRWEKYKPAK